MIVSGGGTIGNAGGMIVSGGGTCTGIGCKGGGGIIGGTGCKGGGDIIGGVAGKGGAFFDIVPGTVSVATQVRPCFAALRS